MELNDVQFGAYQFNDASELPEMSPLLNIVPLNIKVMFETLDTFQLLRFRLNYVPLNIPDKLHPEGSVLPDVSTRNGIGCLKY